MADFKQNYFQRRTKDRGPRSNNRISSPEVQVIASNGENLGILNTNEAISIFEIDVDLVSKNQSHGSIYYKTPSKYPTMERDITLLLNKEIPAETIVENIAKHKLVQRSYITDIYHDQNIDAEKKSATFRIIFQSMARTLSSKEIDKVQIPSDNLNKDVFREYDIRGISETDFSDDVVIKIGKSLSK